MATYSSPPRISGVAASCGLGAVKDQLSSSARESRFGNEPCIQSC